MPVLRKQSSIHIPSLDGWRGLAFLSVFCFHYLVTSDLRSRWVWMTENTAAAGWIGVDLFFVLSGFLITGILLDTRDGRHYYRNFIARRALRIFPLFYGLAAVLLLLTPVLHLQWRPAHLAYLFYAGNVASNLNETNNQVLPALNLTHTWTLCVEEQFYLLWPFIVYRVKSTATLLRLCVAAMAGSLLLRALALYFWGTRGAVWSYGELPTHCDPLLCGAIVAILVRQTDGTTLVRWSRWPLGLTAVAIVAVAGVDGQLNIHQRWTTLVAYPLLGVFFSCVIVRAMQPESFAARLGSLPVLRFFGRYSYGMYIFHWIFAPSTTPLLRMAQADLHSRLAGSAAYVVLMLGLTTLLATLSYRFYEQPWLKLKRLFPYDPPPAFSPNKIGILRA